MIKFKDDLKEEDTLKITMLSEHKIYKGVSCTVELYREDFSLEIKIMIFL